MALQTLYAAPVQKIAVFRALFLGDLLLTTPALRALRRRFPRAEITLIGLPWAEAFVVRAGGLIDRLVHFVGYPGIQEVPVEPARTAAFLAEQQAYGYDLALQMHGDGTVSNGLVAALGARRSAGPARPGDTRLDLTLPYDELGYDALRWLTLVELLDSSRPRRWRHTSSPAQRKSGAGGEGTQPILEFHPRPEDAARAAALLAPLRQPARPLVALHAGAKDPARRWPTTSFAQLGDALVQQFDATILLTGAAHEHELTAAIQAAMTAPAHDLVGQTDLGALAALVAQLDLLVTNDTGLSHVAAAMGTPSVVLFGPTRPANFAPPDRQRHRVVDAYDYGCTLAALPVAPVFEACERQLLKERVWNA